ncbi:LysM peptidoglycan-binding domain-containing protein [Thermomicrobium sp. 4228-Ro]|uniref:LysM peptidoglycan-binding domain-containing protein n=1 Tax=Thermomicrobium sp. 4228-Ro TaxID=2993937 RepID=UPI002248E62A|nr:LysM peptidoglycan-binding domain-containing protein [Thermomicrobium sp. 4228-Ro]MCX2727257.1 LysM peptidoglycan-binding domain-containing protein [Thermomicrobium sp. 4228-Ro]
MPHQPSPEEQRADAPEVTVRFGWMPEAPVAGASANGHPLEPGVNGRAVEAEGSLPPADGGARVRDVTSRPIALPAQPNGSANRTPVLESLPRSSRRSSAPSAPPSGRSAWRMGRWSLHAAVVCCIVVVALGGGFWRAPLLVSVSAGTDRIAALWDAGYTPGVVAGQAVRLAATDPRIGYLATGGLAVKPDVLVLDTYVTSGGETVYDVSRATGRSVDTLLWANNLVDPGAPLPAGVPLRVPPVDGMLHVVREGDTLESIAARYGVTPDVITGYEPNGVQRDTDLVPNRMIMVPGGKMPQRDRVIMYTVQEGDTLWKIAERFGLKVQTITWANSLPDPELIYPGQQLAILPTDGVMVKVKEGDTIESLAEYWGVDPQVIRDYPMNGIGPNGVLRVGQLVMIPGGEPPPPPPPPPPAPAPAQSAPSAPSNPPAQRQAPRGSFIWPTTGVITQYFHAGHNGWDIANNMYTPIVAADSGTVIFSGWNNYGLGYAVAIDHGNGFVTWYGHMAEPPPVQVGQWVNQGQYIGPMGSTGYSTGPHVHFIIMYNGVYQDPGLYLR